MLNNAFSHVAVIGLGYIGLPTAAVLANMKIHVTGVDINKDVISKINQGSIHLTEPGLEIAVQAAINSGYLTAGTEIKPSDAFLIAVPTPLKNNRTPDLSYIKATCHTIAPVLKKNDLVILESTSPVGTTNKLADWLAEARQDLSFPQNCGNNSDIRIAYCPERVLPGKTMQELTQNSRTIGGLSSACSSRAAQFYQIFSEGELFLTNSQTAEMSKLVENSFRDVNIAFANELSMICDKLDINVWQLIKLANQHPRVNILEPGPGVGGHCIAVDPWFIIDAVPDQAQLIKMSRTINDKKKQWVIDKIINETKELIAEKNIKECNITIACLGLSFKANIDDLRESPAVEITKNLRKLFSGKILVVEPYIPVLPEGLKNGITLTSLKSAINDADILVILVGHDAFLTPLHKLTNHPVVIDTRGVLEKQ